MKKTLLLTLLFIPFSAFSQAECIFKVRILQNPPSSTAIISWDTDDKMDMAQWPGVEAKEIADTFKVYHVCMDNGVSVIQAIRPHEKEDEFGFRAGYQIVFWNDNAPAELKDITIGDCVFFKITPFFKTNCMPSGFDRPIELNGVWVSVPQNESNNIYSVEPSSIHKLQPSDCNCEGGQKDINSRQKAILDWWGK